MTKFICTKSLTSDVPEGTVLVGKLVDETRFVLTEDSELLGICNINPRWDRGLDLPLKGELWHWEPVEEKEVSLTDCKSESPQEALDRFEEAVLWNHITSGLPKDDEVKLRAVSKYETAKAELLTWMS